MLCYFVQLVKSSICNINMHNHHVHKKKHKVVQQRVNIKYEKGKCKVILTIDVKRTIVITR